MKWIALVSLVLAGCVPPSTGDTDRLEKRVVLLEEEVRRLQDENLQMRQRLIDVEAGRPRPVPTSSSGISARCEASGERYTLTKAQAEEVFANTNGLATDLRIIPYFDKGVARGFKLLSIREDSFVASCGFQNGDIVTHVNGREISSPDKALEAYSKAKGADRIEFAIERAGAKSFLVISTRS